MAKDEKFEEALLAYRLPPHPERYGTAESGNSLKATVNAVEADTLEVLTLFQNEGTQEHYLTKSINWRKSRPRFGASPDLSHWTQRPHQGTRWRHFRTHGTYVIVCNAHRASNGVHYVVYRSESDGVIWARAIASWLKPAEVGDGKTVQRFTLVH